MGIFLRGVAMGLADVVPGVSGGTIAFITGIYERLINAIKGFVPAFWQLARSRDVQDFWRRADLGFLLLLFGGILAAVATASRAVLYALETYPQLLWAFFFGLIVASAWLIKKQMGSMSGGMIVSLVVGLCLAVGVTQVTPTHLELTPLTTFLVASVAICAMILPGISGSFILVLLGAYRPVMEAIKGFDLMTIAVFGSGCAFGLLAFSQFLSYALRHYRNLTLALLTGFMLGSLPKVWPWKLEGSGGEESLYWPLAEGYTQVQDPQLVIALSCMAIGVLAVWLTEKVSQRGGAVKEG